MKIGVCAIQGTKKVHNRSYSDHNRSKTVVKPIHHIVK